jgi:hypothetical protein
MISHAARHANRRAYALQRGEFVRGEYVVYDGGRLIARCTDSLDLGTRIIEGPPLSPNYFWTVVDAEHSIAHGYARVSFCTVSWDPRHPILAEMRPRLNHASFSIGDDSVTRVSCLIDTGSQVSILSKDVVDRLKLHNKHPSSFRSIVGIVRPSVACPVHWLTVELYQSGEDNVILHHPFLVSGGEECIIGMDFLHFFDLRIRGHHPVTLRPLQRIISRRVDLGLQ